MNQYTHHHLPCQPQNPAGSTGSPNQLRSSIAAHPSARTLRTEPSAGPDCVPREIHPTGPHPFGHFVVPPTDLRYETRLPNFLQLTSFYCKIPNYKITVLMKTQNQEEIKISYHTKMTKTSVIVFPQTLPLWEQWCAALIATCLPPPA